MAESSSRTIALPAIVDLDALDPIRDELVDAVEAGEVKVACSGTERIATNALFLLLSAAETARRNNFGFTVTAPSEAFRAAVSRLVQSTREADLLQVSDSVFRMRRARRNCEMGWVTLACQDYHAVAAGMPGYAMTGQIFPCARVAASAYDRD